MEPHGRAVKVGVGAIVLAGDELLLMRRAQAHGRGTWSTPGGGLEPGESLEECARRETFEEVGLEITAPRFVAVTNDVFPDGRHYLTVWFAGDAVGGRDARVEPNGEVAEFAWFALSALPSPLFLPFQNLVLGRGYPSRDASLGLTRFLRAGF